MAEGLKKVKIESMLLTISSKGSKAGDLSFLLHKHPDKLQSVDLSVGKAHIFYPDSNEEICTVALLLDINPVELAKSNKNNRADFSLAQYVNDRPYVASSFLSVAIAKAFASALNGTCHKKPELVDKKLNLDVFIPSLPAPSGGELIIKKFFEPLGYQVNLKRHVLDNEISEWGDSRYYALNLSGKAKLKDLLSHLYVLIPCLDQSKHYWVSQSEIEKLLQKGAGWLEIHPEKDQITKRYLRNIGAFTRYALERLNEKEVAEEQTQNETENVVKDSLHNIRLKAVASEIKEGGAQSILDLGCGEGKLLNLFLKEKQFTQILGMDVSFASLERAKDFLRFTVMAPRLRAKINLIQGSLIYRDERLTGFDAAAIVEVIEHLDMNRLRFFERVVFEFARPKIVVLTTPNKEYNQLFDGMPENQFRHKDHRFEWTRDEFFKWCQSIAEVFGYEFTIKPIGEEDDQHGAPSQMVVFKLKSK